jgi:hypothetical protein
MKIVQISAVIENETLSNNKVQPYMDATVYGLGDDQKLYYWTEVEKKKGFSLMKTEEAEPETEMGWKLSGTA